MVPLVGLLLALLYGTVLIWAAMNLTRTLVQMVRPHRPAAFVCLHLTAVWSVGLAAVVAGITLILQGLALIDDISQTQ